MARYHNLVLFFDGTWNTHDSETNVWKLRGDLRLGDYSFAGEADQYFTEAFYVTGPGTSANMSLYGGGLAADLGVALEDAYAWLCEKVLNLRLDDPDAVPQVYAFGFSRGAYRAHVFSWLLHDVGILRNFANCRKIVRAFVGKDAAGIRGLLSEGSLPSPPIAMLGLWDVVTAPLDLYSGFNDGLRSPLVRRLYHAMAANECRINFPVMQYDPKEDGTTQMWFSGAHSDVGGGYPPGERELSDIALAWMRERAFDCGLDFLGDPVDSSSFDFIGLGKIHDEASGLVRRNRQFLEGELVHESLRRRSLQVAGYTPEVDGLPSSAAGGGTMLA